MSYRVPPGWSRRGYPRPWFKAGCSLDERHVALSPPPLTQNAAPRPVPLFRCRAVKIKPAKMMMSTGIVPDAMVSRCLVDAFAMDDSFSDGGAHPLSLLDWSKFQPKHRDGRYVCVRVCVCMRSRPCLSFLFFGGTGGRAVLRVRLVFGAKFTSIDYVREVHWRRLPSWRLVLCV